MRCIDVKKLSRSGMTLIEVIISMAILGILSVVFLTIFTSGYIGVSSAGKRTEVGYEAQKAIEELIISGDTETETITIFFQDGPTLVVDGNKIEKEINNGEHSINITTFIPNP